MMLSIEEVQAVESEQNQERLTKLLDMAFWHNQAGNLEAAVLACEAALMIYPDSTTAHSLLGSLYEKKDDDAKAIEHFEAVVRLNPDSAADVAKLDQIRRGVHVKAVAPPPAYKWIPPALVSMNWGGWKGKGGSALSPVSLPSLPDRYRKPLPLIAAGTAALLVLGIGLLAIRPSRPVDAAVRQTKGTPMQTVNMKTSAYGGPMGGNPNSGQALPVPVVLKPRSSSSPAITAVAPDPFGETLAPGMKTSPLFRSKHGTRNVRTASLSGDDGTALALPPLSLRAVPLARENGDGGLAPAPVAVPMMATTAPVPQHTVVVSNLGGSQYPPMQMAPAPPPQYGQYNSAPQSSLASHIKITINDSPANNSISISDHGDSRPASRSSNEGDGQDGDSFQQSALALQQQGDLRGAKSAYQKAIKAYKSQIASGHDADAATQGLAASQTGLQICDQGQQ